MRIFKSAAGRIGLAVFAAIALVMAASPSQAQSARIRVEIVKAGFIVSVSGGSGTLTFRGRRYPLSIGGVSLGATFGASKAVLVGRAYNLRRASDIAGTYAAAGAGVAVVSGARTARLTNANGVELALTGRQLGLEFSVDLSGMEIALR